MCTLGKKIVDGVSSKDKLLAWKSVQNAIQDTTTPGEMAKLLMKLYKKEALSASSTDLLIDIMQKCRTGGRRIKGLLPRKVKVAHKTGTWAPNEEQYLNYPGSEKLFRFASDVGIITLPNNKGHIAIAIYVKSKDPSDDPRTQAIALASRAIYNYFMQQI